MPIFDVYSCTVGISGFEYVALERGWFDPYQPPDGAFERIGTVLADLPTEAIHAVLSYRHGRKERLANQHFLGFKRIATEPRS